MQPQKVVSPGRFAPIAGRNANVQRMALVLAPV
jgi:hypothetical protein